MTPQQERQLVRAVRYWLSFQYVCGRDALFSEGYLDQPIGEYLMGHYGARVSPEHNHPALHANTPGRPRQIDFVALSKDRKRIEFAIEAKWITDTPYPRQAIMDDLLRLECVRDPSGQHVARYFLVAGTKQHVKTNFTLLEYNDARRYGFTKTLLSFQRESSERAVEVFDAPGGLRKFYRKFHKHYDVEMPQRFKTTLVCRSTGDVCAYLWKISSNRNRATFVPDEDW